LHAGANQYPVRIRNISSRGALIDASKFPERGSRVRLSRGSLAITGNLAWQDEHYGGINFEHEIDVGSWTQRAGHRGQHRIDVLMGALKRSEPLPEHLEAAMPMSLGQMSAELDEICESLANLPEMSAKFAEELVRLDSVAQRLRDFIQSPQSPE
jgi:hypothetical protein